MLHHISPHHILSHHTSHGTTWYDVTWQDMARHDIREDDITWYDILQPTTLPHLMSPLNQFHFHIISHLHSRTTETQPATTRQNGWRLVRPEDSAWAAQRLALRPWMYGICFYENNFRSRISTNMEIKSTAARWRERSRREKKAELEERRYRCAKCQASLQTSFKSNDLGVGGSKSRFAKAAHVRSHVARGEITDCTPLLQKTHLQVTNGDTKDPTTKLYGNHGLPRDSTWKSKEAGCNPFYWQIKSIVLCLRRTNNMKRYGGGKFVKETTQSKHQS